jgi:hypothetical protein
MVIEAMQRARGNVRVHHHGGRADFVIEIAAKDPDDRMIVAQLEPAGTLGEMVDRVLAALPKPDEARPGSSLESRDVLLIPKVSAALETVLDELRGTGIESGPFAGRTVAQAQQAIDLSLDEHGATASSEAVIVRSYSAPAPPRHFVCDGPFMLMLMRREASRPYLVAWIATPDSLRPAT